MHTREPSTAPGRVEGGGQPVLSFEQCFILFCSFPLLFVFVVGGLGFELCVFIAGWRHALRSEWPYYLLLLFSVNTVQWARCLQKMASLTIFLNATRANCLASPNQHRLPTTYL